MSLLCKSMTLCWTYWSSCLMLCICSIEI